MNAAIKVHMLITLFIIGVGASSVEATDRYYADQKVTSPSGRYILEATSPDNAGEAPKPFARNFTYTLTNTTTETVIWQRLQSRHESSPARVFVDDSGWVVIRTSGDDLLAIEPVTGQLLFKVDLLRQFTAEETRKNVSMTTAGPMWTRNSRWSFLTHQDCNYFIVRTGWDRRIIVNLKDQDVEKEPNELLLEACDESDRLYVVATCKQAQDLAVVDGNVYKHYWKRWHLVKAAVHIAGRLEVCEAADYLRSLAEQSTHLEPGGNSRYFRDEPVSDGFDPYAFDVAVHRREIHQALRRLGEQPELLPCIRFRDNQQPEAESVNYWMTSGLERTDKVHLIKPRMEPRQVLEVIGPPDYIFSHLKNWEYDIDAADPYTLRVTWTPEHTVKEVTRVTPARWMEAASRYRGYDW